MQSHLFKQRLRAWREARNLTFEEAAVELARPALGRPTIQLTPWLVERFEAGMIPLPKEKYALEKILAGDPATVGSSNATAGRAAE